MNPTVQHVVVFVVVGLSASYAGLRFMPAAWRRSIAARVASVAMRSGLSAVQARRVETKLSSGGACGSCDSCKACATPTGAEAEAPSASFRDIPIRRAS